MKEKEISIEEPEKSNIEGGEIITDDTTEQQPPVISEITPEMGEVKETISPNYPPVVEVPLKVQAENTNEPVKEVVKSEPKQSTAKKRWTKSVNFTEAEGEIIQKIIDERVKAGLSESADHFIQQCVDFAINFNFANTLVSVKSFGVPDDYKPKLLKKGIYQQNKALKPFVCK